MKIRDIKPNWLRYIVVILIFIPFTLYYIWGGVLLGVLAGWSFTRDSWKGI